MPLKFQHPGAIVRERTKALNNWESLKTVKYANGVEYQVLIGQLPHQAVQSVLAANRELTLAFEGDDLVVKFGPEAVAMPDFAAGERPTGDAANVKVLDGTAMAPTADAKVAHGGETLEGTLAEDGHTREFAFADGTVVRFHLHGHHAHLEAVKDEQAQRCFYHGPTNTIHVVGPVWTA